MFIRRAPEKQRCGNSSFPDPHRMDNLMKAHSQSSNNSPSGKAGAVQRGCETHRRHQPPDPARFARPPQKTGGGAPVNKGAGQEQSLCAVSQHPVARHHSHARKTGCVFAAEGVSFELAAMGAIPRASYQSRLSLPMRRLAQAGGDALRLLDEFVRGGATGIDDRVAGCEDCV